MGRARERLRVGLSSCADAKCERGASSRVTLDESWDNVGEVEWTTSFGSPPSARDA
jgi:hypothetical protein